MRRTAWAMPQAGFLLVATALALSACTIQPWDGPPVTRQRPVFAPDTSTTAEQTVEIEGGMKVDPRGGEDYPLVLKWGAAHHTELFLSWSPLVRVERPGDDGIGSGDLAAGVRHRFLDEEGARPAVAVQLSARFPTSSRAEGIGDDTIDAFAGLAATKTVGSLGLGGYYQVGMLGQVDGGTETEHGVAADLTIALSRRWTAFAEGAGLFQGAQDAVIATAGLAYAWQPNLVFDVGVAVGLTDDAPSHQFVFGFTYNFGWPGKPPPPRSKIY